MRGKERSNDYAVPLSLLGFPARRLQRCHRGCKLSGQLGYTATEKKIEGRIGEALKDNGLRRCLLPSHGGGKGWWGGFPSAPTPVFEVEAGRGEWASGLMRWGESQGAGEDAMGRGGEVGRGKDGCNCLSVRFERAAGGAHGSLFANGYEKKRLRKRFGMDGQGGSPCDGQGPEFQARSRRTPVYVRS